MSSGNIFTGDFVLGTLDGFIIQKSPSDNPFHACMDDGNTTYIFVNGETISSDWIGGITLCHSNPILKNLIVKETRGTGIYIQDSSMPIIVNTLLHSNSNSGIVSYNSSPLVFNSTISKNTARLNSSFTAGMYNNNSNPLVVNTIVYGNGTSFLEVKNVNSTPQYFYSHVRGETNQDANGNLNGYMDPLFVDPANNDFQLRWNSPCRDKGNGSYYTPFNVKKDLACNPREQGAKIDLGAYEYTTETFNQPIMYVNKNVTP